MPSTFGWAPGRPACLCPRLSTAVHRRLGTIELSVGERDFQQTLYKLDLVEGLALPVGSYMRLVWTSLARTGAHLAGLDRTCLAALVGGISPVSCGAGGYFGASDNNETKTIKDRPETYERAE